MNTGTNHKLELTEPTSTMTPQNKLPEMWYDYELVNGMPYLKRLNVEKTLQSIVNFLTPQEEEMSPLHNRTVEEVNGLGSFPKDNQTWEEKKFEKYKPLVVKFAEWYKWNVDNEFFGTNMMSEWWINELDFLLFSEYDRGSREMAEAIMKKVKSKSTLLTEVSEYEAGRQKVLDEIEEILTTYLKG